MEDKLILIKMVVSFLIVFTVVLIIALAVAAVIVTGTLAVLEAHEKIKSRKEKKERQRVKEWFEIGCPKDRGL